MSIIEDAQRKMHESLENNSHNTIIEAEEDEQAKEAISSLAKNDFGEEEDQYGAVELIKGLASSKADISNEFFKLLNEKLTEIGDEVLNGDEDEDDEE